MEWNDLECFVALPPAASPGRVVEVVVLAQNPWDRVIAYSVRVAARLTKKLHAITATPCALTLGSGESGVLRIPVMIPSTAPAGTHEIGVAIESRELSHFFHAMITKRRVYPRASSGLPSAARVVAANALGVGLGLAAGVGFFAFRRGTSVVSAPLLIVTTLKDTVAPLAELRPRFEPWWVRPEPHWWTPAVPEHRLEVDAKLVASAQVLADRDRTRDTVP